MAKMEFGGRGIEEVDHGAAGVRAWHDELLPVVRADEAEDRPFARGDVPPHPAAGVDPVREVDDPARIGDGLRAVMRHGQHRHVPQVEGPRARRADTAPAIRAEAMPPESVSGP